MICQTSPDIAEKRGQGRLGRFGRWAAGSAKLAGAVGFITLLASSGTVANAAETSSRMAQERHACAVVMGLHKPGDLYDTCIRSLNKTLSEFDQARQVSKDRSACVQEGRQPGTRAFALCVVNAEQSPTDASRYAGIVPIH